MDLLKSIGITGIAVLVAFYLVRDVIAPLVKNVIRRSRVESEPRRLQVLEVNLSTLTTRVEDFGKVLAEQNEMVDKLSISVDNKMDIVLAELKEMRDEFSEAYRAMAERIAKAETHIEHLLRTRAARGQS